MTRWPQPIWGAESARTAAMLLASLAVFWAFTLTTLMLRDDPATFHCGDSACSVGEITRLIGRNALVALWLATPYVAIGLAFSGVAPHLNRAMPRWLRWHPRWTSAMQVILGVLLGVGHIWITYATYLMLKHNPQGVFCTEASSLNEANFYPSCAVTLDELAMLFARNMFLLGVVLMPIVVVGWLLTVLGVSLLRGRGRKWFRLRAVN